MRLIALLALLAVGPVFAQTCEPAPNPLPRDAARLEWPAVTTWLVEGTAAPLPSGVVMTYIVLEVVNGAEVRRCTTTDLTAGFTGLEVGTHTWLVRTATPSSEPPWVWSRAASPTWSKTIAAVPVARLPLPPTALSGN